MLPPVTTPIGDSISKRVAFNRSAATLGKGLLLGSTGAAAGGLVAGLGTMVSTARANKKTHGTYQADWPQVIERATVWSRASWTCMGFAHFLFPNALRFAIGREVLSDFLQRTGQEAPATAEQLAELIRDHKLIPDSARLLKIFDKMSVGGMDARQLLSNPLGQAAVIGTAVGLAGALAVFAQRITDTAIGEWKEGHGFKPNYRKSAQSALKVSLIGLIAGGAARFILPGFLKITVS
jgi:hypothetical protein